eukprot:3421610-Amphidinium_carterae.1
MPSHQSGRTSRRGSNSTLNLMPHTLLPLTDGAKANATPGIPYYILCHPNKRGTEALAASQQAALAIPNPVKSLIARVLHKLLAIKLGGTPASTER